MSESEACDGAAMTLTYADVERAAAVLSPHLLATPVLRSVELDDRCRATVLLKAEHLQLTGSFKIRGALNGILTGRAEKDDRGVITISSRNHARAVARAARIAGVPATIIMLRDASPLARAAAERDGATVVAENITKFNRESVGDRILLEEDLRWIHPFEGAPVLAGQGTVAKELLDEAGAPDVVVVPVGGGGLIGGMAVALRERAPGTRIIGVEPELADDARQSLAAGRIVVLPEQPAMLADTVDNMHIGSTAFSIMREHVDAVVTVSEDEIAAAMWALWCHAHQLVEPAGALALAPVLSGALADWIPPAAGGAPPTVACILTGSNIDLATVEPTLGRERSRHLAARPGSAG
jgi:threonine dehydratase